MTTPTDYCPHCGRVQRVIDYRGVGCVTWFCAVCHRVVEQDFDVDEDESQLTTEEDEE